MIVKCIRDEGEFRALRAAWNGILAQSSSNHVFLTHEWVDAWWNVYGEAGRLRVYVVEDDRGTPVGIAPFHACSRPSPAGRLTELSLLAGGEVGIDFINVLLPAGRESELLATLWPALAAEPWQRMVLDDVEAEASSLPALRALARAAGAWAQIRPRHTCPFMDLPRTWDEFMQMPDVEFKVIVRSKMKKLFKKEVALVEPASPGDVSAFLDRLFELHAERWQREGRAGTLADERIRRFYRRAANAAFDAGWLRLTGLAIAGRIETIEFGLLYNGMYYSLQGGCSVEGMRRRAGSALQYKLFESLVGRADTFHFLRGAEPYKYQWGCRDKYTARLSLARGVAGRLSQAVENAKADAATWVRRKTSVRAREWVKRAVRRAGPQPAPGGQADADG